MVHSMLIVLILGLSQKSHSMEALSKDYYEEAKNSPLDSTIEIKGHSKSEDESILLLYEEVKKNLEDIKKNLPNNSSTLLHDDLCSENPLNSFKNRNIVVFLGNIGVGKTTLINYLSGKKLKGDEMGDVVFDDPNEVSEMKICHGKNKGTVFPAFIDIEPNMTFCDLPGFKDPEATLRSLINAGLLKKVIESAHSTKLVFVIAEDEIKPQRGKRFEELLSKIVTFIPNQDIHYYSSLIITKYSPKVAPLSKYITIYIESSDLINHWIANERLLKMSIPNDSIIGTEERDAILSMISKMEGMKIKKIDTSIIYTPEDEKNIIALYNYIITLTIDEVVDALEKSPYIINENNLTLDDLEVSIEYFCENFMVDARAKYDNNDIIKILQILTCDNYIDSLSNLLKFAEKTKQQILRRLNEEYLRRVKKLEVEKNEAYRERNKWILET